MIRKYPKHFYEPIRIEIAANQMRHDFRKLFPDFSEKEWEKVDRNILEWFSGEKFELEPVHDFWNFFNGFARELKLKSLTSWITAENVAWEKREVPVKDIIITWDFPGFEFMGRAPFSAQDVRNRLNQPEMKQHKARMRQESDQRSAKYPARDQFPVILFYDPRGGVITPMWGYYVLEGNRRTARAITHDSEKLLAYVGHFTDPADLWPQNYWIPTGIMRDLIFLSVLYDKERDEKAFETVRKFYQLLLRDFDLARVATIDKSFKNFERDDRLLHDLLTEDLK